MQTPGLYINPLTDYGFKKVFGDEEIMREFLNDLLKPASPIRHVISPQGYKGKQEKGSADGDIVRKSWNFDLKPVYGIFFLNFPLDGFQPRLVRTVRFIVEETGEVFNDKVRAYTIELPCMKGLREQDCKDVLDYWSYNLYNMETMNTQLSFTDQKPIFMKMAEVASYPNMNPEQQRIYMDSLNNYRTVMAAKEYDFGRGMEKGIEKEKKSNAKSMKALGLDFAIISKVTGLSVTEINDL